MMQQAASQPTTVKHYYSYFYYNCHSTCHSDATVTSLSAKRFVEPSPSCLRFGENFRSSALCSWSASPLRSFLHWFEESGERRDQRTYGRVLRRLDSNGNGMSKDFWGVDVLRFYLISIYLILFGPPPRWIQARGQDPCINLSKGNIVTMFHQRCEGGWPCRMTLWAWPPCWTSCWGGEAEMWGSEFPGAF